MALHLLKRLVAQMPNSIQDELKRWHFSRQIRRNVFTTMEPEYAMLDQWISPGDWVADVGANVGHYSIKMSRLVGDQGRVLAFEPVARTASILLSNLLCAHAANVSVFNAGLSSELGSWGIVWPKTDSRLENFYQARLVSDTSTGAVLAVTLDRFQFAKKRMSLVKIDVEGHELEVLKGMRVILSSDHPVLIVEGISAEVELFLRGFGYTSRHIPHSPNSIFTP